MAVGRTRSRQLSQQIEELTRQLRPLQAVLTRPYSMRAEHERVIEKHMELFPEDRGAQQIVVIQLFGDSHMSGIPDPSHYEGDERPGDKIGAAWRAVAHELRATNPLQFWEVPTDSLPQ